MLIRVGTVCREIENRQRETKRTRDVTNTGPDSSRTAKSDDVIRRCRVFDVVNRIEGQEASSCPSTQCLYLATLDAAR